MQRVTLSGQNYRSRNGAWSEFPFKCVISRSSCPIMHECNNEQGRNRGIEEAETGDLTGGRLTSIVPVHMYVCVRVRARACMCGSNRLGRCSSAFHVLRKRKKSLCVERSAGWHYRSQIYRYRWTHVYFWMHFN